MLLDVILETLAEYTKDCTSEKNGTRLSLKLQRSEAIVGAIEIYRFVRNASKTVQKVELWHNLRPGIFEEMSRCAAMLSLLFAHSKERKNSTWEIESEQRIVNSLVPFNRRR